MNIEAIGSAVASPPRINEPNQQVDIERQSTEDEPPSSSEAESKVQTEELLSQIKALTEDGLYSVRFEQETEAEQLIVKVVDKETDEVIRQIPPEELINLTKHLNELKGSLVDTEG